MNTTDEFDYQAFMKKCSPCPDEIHRGPKAREQRRVVTKGKWSKKTQSTGVLEIIQEILEISATGDYIYRGEPEHYCKVSSSLYREYLENDVDHIDVEAVQNEILQESKKYIPETDELEILTRLQHYGGATNLIDFSTDYLIALFFACDSSDSRKKEGRVILWDKKGKGIDRVVLPKHSDNRVIAQKSIFVQSPHGFVDPDHVVTIPGSLKLPMLDHLEKYHGISTEVIYNDLHGFIKYQKSHHSAHAKFYAGVSSHNKKKLSEAIEQYTKAIGLNPRLAEAYSNRGAAYRESGKIEKAISDYNQAIYLKPDYADAYNNRGVAYAKRNEIDHAIADFSMAIELNPKFAEAYNNRGNIYRDAGKYDIALQDWDRAIGLRPDYPDAYNNRGAAYRHKGEISRAISDFSKAIALDPKFAGAFFNRGLAYGRKEEDDLSIADYTKAINLKPDYLEAYSNRAAAYARKSKHDRAIADFSKAIELNPDAVAYYNRGSAYLGKGEDDHAIADFNKATELRGDYAEAYNNRGLAYVNRGEVHHAIADYTRAIELNSQMAAAYNNRGNAHVEMGAFDRAIQDYNDAIQLNPTYPEAHFSRGICWLDLQNWQQAHSDLTIAKNIGMDIIAAFRDDYENVEAFEQKGDIRLPKDIAAMLAP